MTHFLFYAQIKIYTVDYRYCAGTYVYCIRYQSGTGTCGTLQYLPYSTVLYVPGTVDGCMPDGSTASARDRTSDRDLVTIWSTSADIK